MKEELPNARELNPVIPQAVENIIIKAAAKNPKNRFKDVSYARLAREAKNMKKQSGGSGKIVNYMAFLLHTEYNKNLTKNKKLPLRIDIY